MAHFKKKVYCEMGFLLKVCSQVKAELLIVVAKTCNKKHKGGCHSSLDPSPPTKLQPRV